MCMCSLFTRSYRLFALAAWETVKVPFMVQPTVYSVISLNESGTNKIILFPAVNVEENKGGTSGRLSVLVNDGQKHDKEP